MRGLKQLLCLRAPGRERSHLLQMRGLKHLYKKRGLIFRLVASFTDAWIETFNPEFDHIGYQVASFTDAWIETQEEWGALDPFTSHLLQMRGLKP